MASGIDVVGAERIEVGHGEHNRAYLVTKKVAMGHLLDTVAVPDGAVLVEPGDEPGTETKEDEG